MKFIITTLLYIGFVHAQVFISEIERNPIGSESAIPGGKSHEYIELVNLSNDTVLIDSLTLTDGVIRDQLVTIDSPHLKPGTVLLILDQDYFDQQFSSIDYDSNAIICTVNHTSLCGGLTGTDGFQIEYFGDTLCRLSDSITNDEKIEFTSFLGSERDSTTLSVQNFFFQQNWIESTPTPGGIDKLYRSLFREYNLTVDTLFIQSKSFSGRWSYSVIENDISIINNSTNTNAIQYDEVALSEDINKLIIEWNAIEGEQIRDTLNLSTIRIPELSLLINEIHPRGTPEWIELFNQSDEPIQLSNWYLLNSEDTMQLPQLSIQPKTYRVFSKDFISSFVSSEIVENWFSLDNYRDTLFLLSPFGIVDSVYWDYQNYSDWDDKSLHRIINSDGFSPQSLLPMDPTPNDMSETFSSVTPISLTVPNQLFSPDNDGVDDSLQFSVSCPSFYTLEARIFSQAGEETIRFPIESNEGYWNGATASGTTARRGPYILLVEFTNSITGNSLVKRSGIVLWR